VSSIIDNIIRREGGYVNHPADRGGPTNFGITQRAWSAYIGRAASETEMRSITLPEAMEFYFQEYIVKPKFDKIHDPHLRELVIDAGVNHGPRHAAKWLQAAASDLAAGVRLAQDGAIGPLTLSAVNHADPQELFLWVCAYRIRLYGRLVAQDRSQAAFISGWNNRVAEFLEEAAERLEAAHRRMVR
jgi:lysozyme family protein